MKMKINSFAVWIFLLLEHALFVEIFCGERDTFQGAKDAEITPRQSTSKHAEVPSKGFPKAFSTMGPNPDIIERDGSGETVVETVDPYNSDGFFGSTQKIGSNDDNIVYSFDDQYGRDESGCLGCDDEIREMINDSHRSGPGPVETVTELPVTLPPSQEDKDVLDTVFKIAGVVGGLCLLVVLMNCVQVIVIVTYFKKRYANKFEIDDQNAGVPKINFTKNKHMHEEHSIVEVDLKTFHQDDSGDSGKAEVPKISVDSDKVLGQCKQPKVTTTTAVLNFQTDNSTKDTSCQDSQTEADQKSKADQQIPVGSTVVAIDIPLPPPPEVMPLSNNECSANELGIVDLADIATTDPSNTIQLDADEVIDQQKPAISSFPDTAQDEKPEKDTASKSEADVLPQTSNPVNQKGESVTIILSNL